MKRSPMSYKVAMATLAGVLLCACAAFEVFEPAGPRDLVITYTGALDLRVGDRAAITVTVLHDGVPLPSPRLRITISNLSVIELLGEADSLVAVKPGNADLTIELQHSIFAGERPDTTIQLRVRQIGGPGP